MEKKTNIRIVPMNADHLEEIERLERICFSRPWNRRMLAEELENQCAAFLVAEDADSGNDPTCGNGGNGIGHEMNLLVSVIKREGAYFCFAARAARSSRCSDR